jgi:hypothetical protein
MKKRILTSTLTLLFLVSTTGLPVTINLCKLAESNNADECMMHHKPVESHCCSKENSEYSLTASYDNYDCCENEFVFNKVEDEFLFSKTDANFFSSLEQIIQPTSEIPPTIDYSFNESIFCDSSPPFLINPKIHITNSIFLI